MLSRLRLVSELAKVRKELLGLAQGATAVMQRLGLVKRVGLIRADLGRWWRRERLGAYKSYSGRDREKFKANKKGAEAPFF